MFYRFMRGIVRFLLFLFNGNAHYENKENLIDGPYILVGPHRTWFDPIYFALAGSPREFAFMSKEELFSNPFFRFILNHSHAFPVNRVNPGPSAIKTPVKLLKKGDLSLIMFPSGTRHSKELKGGALVIAKLAKVPLIPAVYQGPLSFKGLFTRKRVTVRFGKPIYIDAKQKLDDDYMAEFEHELDQKFAELDHEINPNFIYVPSEKKNR